MEYRLAYERTPTTVISFMLSDENLDPDIITTNLGIPPDESWRKGDKRHLKGLIPESIPPHTFGRWSLNPHCSPYDDFEEQLDRLITRLEALPPILKEYIEAFDGGFLVGYSSGEVSIGFNLSPQIIQRMAALGLSIVFDIYPIEPEGGREYEVSWPS
jgi:hypothetical protein